MTLEQLKNELKEKEKEMIELYYEDGKCIFNEDSNDWKAPGYETLKAEISALKKGISACEEILNSRNKCGTDESKSPTTSDTQTLIEQALSQRNKEILEKINSMNGYVHVDSFIVELKRFIHSQQNKVLDGETLEVPHVVFTNRHENKICPSADTKTHNNLNNTSTNLNLNKGCGKEITSTFRNTREELYESFHGICGQENNLCDDCKKLKAVDK